MTKAINCMEFYYENEAEQFVFYRIPKLLFKDKRFSKISSDAKLLYALFLDRMSLSKKNGWVDEEKKVYIYFSVQEIMEELNIGSEKCTKIMSELDDKKGCGLIHKKRQGQGKPTKIYVMKYTSENINNDHQEQSASDDENADLLRFIVKGTPEDPEVLTFGNRNSENSKSENQDFRNSKCNNNKENNNENSNNENSNNEFSDTYPILSDQKISFSMTEMDRYREIINVY